NDLREEIRKAASDRFSQEMTELRDEARRLDENQGRLSEQLDNWSQRPPRGLRDTGERQQVRQGLDEQGKKLDQVMDRMRKTVEEAEETEPVLANELFDTVKKANEQTIPDALKDAGQLVDAGIPEEAAKSSRRAGRGIAQLREGVERAARSVIGDDTAALRRAQGELDDLAEQINREIARSSGREPPGQDAQQAGQRGQQGQEGQQGQPGEQRDQQQGQQAGGDSENPQGQPGQRGERGQGGLRGGNDAQAGAQRGQAGARGDAQRDRQGGTARGGSRERGGLDRLLDGLGGGPG